jgi:hypothetical protein
MQGVSTFFALLIKRVLPDIFKACVFELNCVQIAILPAIVSSRIQSLHLYYSKSKIPIDLSGWKRVQHIKIKHSTRLQRPLIVQKWPDKILPSVQVLASTSEKSFLELQAYELEILFAGLPGSTWIEWMHFLCKVVYHIKLNFEYSEKKNRFKIGYLAKCLNNQPQLTKLTLYAFVEREIAPFRNCHKIKELEICGLKRFRQTTELSLPLTEINHFQSLEILILKNYARIFLLCLISTLPVLHTCECICLRFLPRQAELDLLEKYWHIFIDHDCKNRVVSLRLIRRK